MVSTPRSNSSSHAASVRSSRPPTCAGPTVFTSAWHSPHRSSRNVNAASTSPVSRRSHSSPMASSAPAARSSSSASRRWLGVRASTATRAPSVASSSAVARPTPAGAARDDRGAAPSPRSIRWVDSSWRARCSAESGSPVARVDQLVPAQRRAGREHVVDAGAAPASRRSTRPPVLGSQRRVELRREQLAVEVVLVVDGRRREVDLRRPVGRVTAVGPVHAAGSARRGPTRACRGRRRGRRRGCARRWSSPAPSVRTPAARPVAGVRERAARSRRRRSSVDRGDLAQPRRGRVAGGP